MSVEKIISHWKARVLSNPVWAAQFDAVYKITITGQGAGTWLFRCREPVQVQEGGGEAQCAVTMSADDLAAISSGVLNPQAAFLEGRIKVEGDVYLALKLDALFFDNS